MAFTDIFNAVNAQMTALVTTAGYPGLVPAYSFGPTQAHTLGAPPRCSWGWPMAEKFITPRLQGPSNNPSQGQPRALRSRVIPFEIDVWGPCKQFGPAFQVGSNLGTLALSGAPVSGANLVSYGMAIQILAGGTQFQYSTDSGQTWSGALAVGSSVALGSTGVVAALTGNFQGGDTFRWVANDMAINDFATTEWMVETLCVAIHQVLHGSYELTGGQWMNQDGSDTVQDGKVYKLSFEVEKPILEMFSPGVANVKVTSIQQTDIIGNSITIP